MAKHAKLSPSSAKRWMSCPGSVALSEGIVEKPSSFADEGTAAHFLGSVCLENHTDASGYVGRTIYLRKSNHDGQHFESFSDAHPESKVLNSFIVQVDMAAYVQIYVDYVRDLVKSTGGALFVEVSVPLTHMTDEEDAYGTSDVVILADDEIIVVDLKYGMGVEVSAEENPQLLMYASGARKEFELAGTFNRFRMAISQPRITSLPSEWCCSSVELDEFEMQVAKAVKQVHSCDAKENLHPTSEACRWCKAKADCPALSKKVEEEVGADFDNLLTGPKPTVDQYDNAELSTHAACIDLIEMWCKAVRGKVESELFAGRDVAGFKLVQGRKGSRAWSDKAAVEELMKSMRLKHGVMYSSSIISPAVADKAAKDGTIKAGHWKRLQEVITQSEGKASVAPVTDKRPALVMNDTENDFDVVDPSS